MPLVYAFVAGCLLAQVGWSFAARDAQALDAPAFRFAMLAGIEILVAGVSFASALFATAKPKLREPSVKSVGVAFFAGALTLTVAGAPYSLVPRLVQGEAQYVILIATAAIVSGFLGALAGSAFRAPQ